MSYLYLPTLFDIWLGLLNNPLIPQIAAQHGHYQGPWDVPLTRAGVSGMITSLRQTDWLIDNSEHREVAYIVPSEYQSKVVYDPFTIPYLRFIVALESDTGAPLFIQWPVATVLLGNNAWQSVGRELPPFVNFPITTLFDAYDSQFDFEMNFAREDASNTFERCVFNAPVFAYSATFTDCTFNAPLYVEHPIFINSFAVPEPGTLSVLMVGLILKTKPGMSYPACRGRSRTIIGNHRLF